MRYLFLIFNFYYILLFSQVGAPDLRCLQVLNNGDVTLFWLQPSDPGALFNSYDIYYATSPSGPYSVVGTVNAINTTSFTHSSTNANNASVYYYLKTKFGAGGASVSLPSDTLKSIFLNLINTAGAPDIKILYNNVHAPKLASTFNNYSILKEYPMSTWNNFATTTASNYADTISVCQASLNYQISLPDMSGCISKSNLIGGLYKDKKNPNQPFIDSISVLPNGNTVIAWHVPRDLDISKYIIVKNISNINTLIDSVKGRLNTQYTFTTTEANNNAVQLYVFAVDSCNNPGSFDIKPSTMFLKVNYDKCAYKAQLTWNSYPNMPKGILEYRVYSSVNGSVFLKIGSTTQTNFTVNNVPADKNVCYFVRVVNVDQSITASSNQSCFYSKQVAAPGFVYIKKVSVKNKTTAQISLFVDSTKASKGIDIYRSQDGASYSPITFIPFNGGATYTYFDEQIESNQSSYYYKAVVRDSCGNLRTQSNVSKTILLKVLDDNESIFIKHLNWNDYLGFAGGVSGYNIYRVINDIPSNAPVAATGPSLNNYVDNLENEAPNGSKIDYLVEAVEGISNPYGFMELSNSNTNAVYMEGKVFVPTAFSPKGINKIWLPITHFVDKSEYTVTVYNRWGQKMFETHDDSKGWDGAGATNDVYVYLISYKNARGEYKDVKGTFVLFN